MLCSLLGSATAAKEIESGLRVGDLAEPFLVKDCTGPAAGKTLCYYCRYAERPVVALFVRQTNDELADFVQRLEEAVTKHADQRWAAFVVLIGDDTRVSEKRLKQIAKDRRLRHTPLTIYRDQDEKLTEVYRLSPEAKVTALVWEKGKVVLNRAYPTGELTSQQIDRFVSAMEAALPAR